MDLRLTPEEQDAFLDDALKNRPLAVMPADITSAVMARIQKDARPALVTWNDFALSLAVAACIGAVFFAAQSLPPIMLVKLRIQGILLYQDVLVNIRWLVPAMLFGLGAFFSALTIPYLRRQL
jgi:hypothetical protein